MNGNMDLSPELWESIKRIFDPSSLMCRLFELRWRKLSFQLGSQAHSREMRCMHIPKT